MSCCPHCGGDLRLQLGDEKHAQKGEDFDSDPKALSGSDPGSALLCYSGRGRVRGKAREYSAAFQVAWRAYGRGEEKQRAYVEWLIAAQSVGGEPRLLPLILAAFKWQVPTYAAEGWKFAPYFERYLKRRKWEDEPPQTAVRPQRVQDHRQLEATDRKVAEFRAARDRTATPAELAEYRTTVSQLAEAKAVKP